MASLEQLQMLDDDETSTSSSSSSNSNRTTDDVANSYLSMSNDYDTDDKSMGDENEGGDDTDIGSHSHSDSKKATCGTTASTTAVAAATGGNSALNLAGHHKKRIKLSFGGSSIRAMVASAEQERQNNRGSNHRVAEENQAGRDDDDIDVGEAPAISSKEKPTDYINTIRDESSSSQTTIGHSQLQLLSREPTSINNSGESYPDNKTTLVKVEAGTCTSFSQKVFTEKSASIVGKKVPKPHPTSKQKTNPKPKTKAAASTTTTTSKNNTKEMIQRQPQQPKKQSLSASSSSAAISGGATNSIPSSTTKKRGSMRSIRITPLSSPGLLLPPGTSNARGQNAHSSSANTNNNDENPRTTLVSTNDVFTQTMATAGYTTEARTEAPHRGSSVQRVVDDMFDSDVKFCLHFPKLLPDDWYPEPVRLPSLQPSKASASPIENPDANAGADAVQATTTSSGDGSASTTLPVKTDPAPEFKAIDDRVTKNVKLKSMTKLSERLIKAFRMNSTCSNGGSSSMGKSPETTLTNKTKPSSSPSGGLANNGVSTRTRNQSRMIPQYLDMAPLSLTLPYPNEYIQKRLEYIAEVNERERAIVLIHKEQETLDADLKGKIKSSITDLVVPPIPPLPQIPEPNDLRGITHIEEIFGSQGQQQQSHPLYLPENNRLVDHLDKRCFHVMSGRYFGLSSNTIADPYFYGPSAPGIGGLNLSATTGLATASTGGGAGSLGGPLLTTPGQPSSTTTPSSSSGSAVATNISKTSSSQVSSSSSKTTSFNNNKTAADKLTKTKAKTPSTQQQPPLQPIAAAKAVVSKSSTKDPSPAEH